MPNYDFTPELKKKIWQAIYKHWPMPTCPICEGIQWEMPDGIATVPLLKNVWTNDRISGLPCAALVCTTCGNTLFFNLNVLGFALDIGPNMDELRKSWGLPPKT